MNNKKKHRFETESPFVEKVVKINRVNKVVKGGKRLAFRAFVVTGDKDGKVGLGLGKSKEVPSAIRKAIERANKSMTNINTFEGTIPHEVQGKFGASKVIIKPAPEGTGVIAGGSLRVILESIGIKNVVGKSLGSRNPLNMALAAINALKKCKNKAMEEKERGVAIATTYKGK